MTSNWTRHAIFLSWFTIGYNLVEGAVSITFGVDDESVALAGFGIDSLIEVASAALVLWRFRVHDVSRERKATLSIGILFLLLALVTAIASIFQLQTGAHPATTVPGLAISAASLSFMFWLWSAKRGVARQLNSASMMKDATCSLVCIQLSLVLFVGSLTFALIPSLWWIDSAAALVIAALIGKEGWATVRSTQHPEFSGGCT